MQVVLLNDCLIRRCIFFRHDFNRLEVLPQSGAFEFARLLKWVSFGHENEAMARAEIGQGLRYSGNDLDGVLGNGVGKAVNGLAQRGRERLNGDAFKGVNQGLDKAVQAISVLADGFALYLVQLLPHLLRREFVMVEKSNAIRNGAVE